VVNEEQAGVATGDWARGELGSVVLASIRDAVCVTDAEGRITLWNPGAASLFALPAERARGRRAMGFVRRARVTGSAALLQAVEAGEAWTGDVVLPGLNGDRIVDVVTYPVHKGVPAAARVYICWDVTRARQTAHADAHLAAVVEQAGDAILTVDRSCRVLTWNRGAERLAGVPAAQAIGAPCPFACDDECRRLLHEPAFIEGTAVTLPDSWLTAADGSMIPVSLAASPIRDADGVIRRLSIIARDERPRRDADREIRFRDAILENTDDAVIATDQDRRITFWSRGAERLFGVLASDALGRPADEVMNTRHHGIVSAEAEQRLVRGEAVRTDAEFGRPDGSTFVGEVTVNLAQMADGGRVHLAMIRDVTDVRRAAVDSARLAAIVESAADIIYAVGQGGRITSWNPGAERVLGYDAARIVGRTIAAIVAPDSLPEAMALREAVLGGAQSASGELVYAAQDGTRIPVWVGLAPIRDATGVVAVSTIAHDLRGRLVAEDQLRQAQKLDAVSRLAAGIAHDFSNLVTAINGYATLLLGDVRDDPAATTNVRQILQAAGRAGDLTRSLVALSGDQRREPEDVDLDRLLNGLVETLRRALPERVALVADAASGARVRVDPTDLEVALLNLVRNAGEAMAGGGQVVVATRGTTLDPAFAAGHRGVTPGLHAELVVRDTGPGIAPEVLDRLFEPRFTTKEPGTGAGMGLATVRASVERAGGTIWVDPGNGIGATFRIYLPVIPGTDVTAPPIQPSAHAGGGAGRILVVEDDTQVRALATTILSRAGYQPTAKGDPRRALEVDPASIDLLLTDVVMPDLDGPSLAVALRGRRPDLPVVFMTGFTERVEQDLAALSGQPLLTKPFGPTELLEAVRAALDAPAG
jgi:PAS domain S-box-containing protein